MSMNSVNDRLAEAESDDRYEGLIIGEVTENVDPQGVGRIKVKIPGLYDTDQGDVPWCLPTRLSPWGQGSGYGVYGSPKIGSVVRLRLQEGDPHYPVRVSDELPVENVEEKFKDPNVWGFRDWGGSELWVNMETGAWEFTHQAGSTIKYDGQGNLTQTVPENNTQSNGGNLSITTVGDTLIKTGGQITLDAPAVVTTGNLTVATGWTGSIGPGQAITVQNGIIIGVEQ